MEKEHGCTLSIIVPVYNDSIHIGRCIKSIVNQKFKDIEVIVVDDGSTDDSWKVINELHEKYSCLKPLHQPNKGVSAARNFGLNNCTGKYVTFADSDDYVDDESINRMMDLMEEKKCDCAIYAVCKEFNDTKNEILLPWSNRLLNKSDILNDVIPLMISGTRNVKSISGSVWRSIFKYEVIENVRFDEDVRIQEDLIFCIRAYANANSMFSSNDCFYHYVKHLSTTTERYRKMYYKESLQFEEKIVEALRDIGIFDKVKERYFSKRVGMYSLCVSNLYRADAPDESIYELEEIINGFKKDIYLKNKVNYEYMDRKKRLIYFLLRTHNKFVINIVSK